MKKIAIILLALFFVLPIAAQTRHKAPCRLNVMTYNILLDWRKDDHCWANRRDALCNLIKFNEVDIMGAQEVLYAQLQDMLERMPEFSFVGYGRTDGKQMGEYSPILYKKSRFKLLDCGKFWLAEDINKPGVKGWDAAYERVATWAIFKDKRSGRKFFYLNTHLDHIGKVARREGAKLILSQIQKLSKGLPVIASGDFNAVVTDEPIQILTDAYNSNHLTHARDLSKLVYGPQGSFTDFNLDRSTWSWIDYIFVKGNFKVTRYGALDDNQGMATDGKSVLFPSDHLPVLSTLVIE